MTYFLAPVEVKLFLQCQGLTFSCLFGYSPCSESNGFLSKQKEHSAVKGATEAIFKKALLPPLQHNHPIQTTSQKAAKISTYMQDSPLVHIPPERYPFPHAGFAVFRACSCFLPLAWAPVPKPCLVRLAVQQLRS